MTSSGENRIGTVESPPPLAPDDAFAAELRGFGAAGLGAWLLIAFGNVLFVPGSAALVLVWRWRSRTPWRELGFRRPQSWLGTLGGGFVLGGALRVATQAVVLPLLGAASVNHAYPHLVGNRAAIPGMLYALIVGAGFGEETTFRGYFFERLGKLFGPGAPAKLLTLLLTSLAFGAVHYPEQGLAGAEQSTLTGLVFGGLYLVTGRLWMSIAAHAAFDLAAYTIIYWGLESRVAHLIF